VLRLRLGRPARAVITIAGCAGLVAGCSRSVPPERRVDPKYGTSPSPRVVSETERVPRGGGTYKLGRPYQIAGRWYVPAEDPNYDRSGVASWYGTDFHGRKTANGEIYNMNAFTAAHPTLPLPSLVYVTNLANGRTVLVRVNDRGPYAKDRLIDLSRETARALGIERNGVGHVPRAVEWR
jgi:rare lipoprotein A